MKVEAEKYLSSWLSNNSDIEYLNFSPESLIVVEKMILTRIDNKQDLIDEKNRDFLLGVLFYVGEVFKRNDNIRKLSWTNIPGRMPILTCRYFSNSWVDIFQKLPSLIFKKSGNVLFDYFNKNIAYFENNSEKLRKENVETPGTDRRSYQYLLQDEECTLNLLDLKIRLKSFIESRESIKSTYFHDDTHLVIDMNTGYFFHLEKKNNKELNIKCSYVIEFWGDEDLNGEYLNEHLFILQQLKEPALSVYDIKSNELINLD